MSCFIGVWLCERDACVRPEAGYLKILLFPDRQNQSADRENTVDRQNSIPYLVVIIIAHRGICNPAAHGPEICDPIRHTD